LPFAVINYQYLQNFEHQMISQTLVEYVFLTGLDMMCGMIGQGGQHTTGPSHPVRRGGGARACAMVPERW